MWTAKRILILIIALLVSLGSFAFYSLAFGIIDGLRPLPPEYLPLQGPPPPDCRIGSPVDEKLQLAFGAGCKEIQHRFRLWLPDKGIAFAAGDFTIDKEKDGLVRLAPFSAAVFHKAKTPNGYPEISTIQCDLAILTLDKAVTNYGELNSRKIVKVEMIGKRGVNITNNRRTAEKNDDVDILISNGPLFYDEQRSLIYSDGVVALTDYQSKPPTVIRGSGLKMTLQKDAPPARPRNAAQDTGNIQTIELLADVQMHFWVDAKAGFLGGMPNTKKNEPVVQVKDAPKAQIHIRTGGPFHYNLMTEQAWFESPPARNGGKDAEHIAPDQVHVERSQEGVELLDQLICDRLELEFRKKAAGDAANPPAAGGDKEIQAARALKRGNNDVTLALDSEKMAAYGSELIYKAGDNVNGPQTVLKGEPQRLLRAVKDGHKLKCIELHLHAANRHGEGQRVWAKGPGEIDMLDAKNPEKVTYPTHLLWQDTLIIVKDREGGQVFDLMTVIGNASFIDDVQKQELHGDKIMVWFLQTQEGDRKVDAVGSGKQELHRVIAQDAVRAISPEYIIRQCAQLTMTFNKKFGRDDRLPTLPEVQVVKAKKEGEPDPTPPKNDPPLLVKPLAAAQPQGDAKKPAPPVELIANEVSIVISTLPDKTQEKKQLDELIAKGNVFVFQAGDVPGEKRIDIAGQLLTLRAGDIGHTLVVYGDREKLARMELGDTILHGPVITINQNTNHADIEGHGAMEMPSNKNLDGTQSAKKNMRVIIQWNKNMTFDGGTARFNGGVQAWEQGAYSQIKCETLSAILDKHVSFKDGQKAKENAKIDRFVCDKNVYVDDAKLNDKKQLEQRTFVMGRDMVNLQGGPTRVTGPGEVRHLAPGSGNLAFGPEAAAPKQDSGKKEWKLTHVTFRDGMTYKTVENTKTATFYGLNQGVEVFHFPTEKINDTMNANQPPKDSLYLRSDMLVVESKQEKERTAQTMIAESNVMFKTDKYVGYADVVKFDDASDVVILESKNGNPVRLFQFTPGGTVPASVNSTKVLYNRRTGEVRSEGVKSITN